MGANEFREGLDVALGGARDEVAVLDVQWRFSPEVAFVGTKLGMYSCQSSPILVHDQTTFRGTKRCS